MIVNHFAVQHEQLPGMIQHYVTFFAGPDTKRELRKWCYNTYGPEGFVDKNWEVRWYDKIDWQVDGGHVILNREEDLTLFLLKWA